MALTQEFKEAVSENRIVKVRIMLKDSMLVDPSFKQFEEMLEYTIKEIPDIFEEHDGEELLNDPSLWNESYLNDQMVSLITNFSEKRIKLLKKMVQTLYKSKISLNENTNSSKNESMSSEKKLGIGITVSGIIITLAGIISFKHPITIIGSVIAILGIIKLITNSKEVC